MYRIEVFLTIYIGKHISVGFKATESLSHFINVYRKGKSLDDLTLAHILTLEDVNQSSHWILAIISDDEKNTSIETPSNFSTLPSINMGFLLPAMRNGWHNL